MASFAFTDSEPRLIHAASPKCLVGPIRRSQLSSSRATRAIPTRQDQWRKEEKPPANPEAWVLPVALAITESLQTKPQLFACLGIGFVYSFTLAQHFIGGVPIVSALRRQVRDG